MRDDCPILRDVGLDPREFPRAGLAGPIISTATTAGLWASILPHHTWPFDRLEMPAVNNGSVDATSPRRLHALPWRLNMFAMFFGWILAYWGIGRHRHY